MQLNPTKDGQAGGLTLITGGTGKIGRRVANRLAERGARARIASRSGDPAFDWHQETTWPAALEGVARAFISFAPDLAIPGASEIIRAFAEKAVNAGVEHLVLLSGRGEEEAQVSERIIQESGARWTIVRASWFNQNFSEGEFAHMVATGEITLPGGDVGEPFVDADDIADVAAAALSDDAHAGEIYEVTGPRLLTFDQVTEEIALASGLDVRFKQIPHKAFVSAVEASGTPKDVSWLMDYLFSTVLDGRNAYVGDGVERALGRKPADFSDFARRMARSGVWKNAA